MALTTMPVPVWYFWCWWLCNNF